MDIVQINVEPRIDLGKKATKAVRKAGLIPAVLYSKKNGVSHFSTKHGDVKTMIFTPHFKLAEISLEGTTRKAIIKDIDFHPVTDEIMHMDFLELVDGHPVIADIPVSFKGVSPGVKGGGKLIRTLRKVTVKTNPENLVDTLFVSIDDLELGSAVRVKDIELPEGVQVMVEGATPVANVEVPRALKSTDAEKEADGGDAAEGEQAEGEASEG